MWYLATITHGIDGIDQFRTGRHCYVNRTVTGKVRVIAAKGITAILPIDAARKCLKVEFKHGQPVPVRNQVHQETRWCETRETRRFDQRHGMAA